MKIFACRREREYKIETKIYEKKIEKKIYNACVFTARRLNRVCSVSIAFVNLFINLGSIHVYNHPRVLAVVKHMRTRYGTHCFLKVEALLFNAIKLRLLCFELQWIAGVHNSLVRKRRTLWRDKSHHGKKGTP